MTLTHLLLHSGGVRGRASIVKENWKMQENLVMTSLYIHSNTNTSYFLAAAPLGKLTGLVFEKPGKQFFKT